MLIKLTFWLLLRVTCLSQLTKSQVPPVEPRLETKHLYGENNHHAVVIKDYIIREKDFSDRIVTTSACRCYKHCYETSSCVTASALPILTGGVVCRISSYGLFKNGGKPHPGGLFYVITYMDNPYFPATDGLFYIVFAELTTQKDLNAARTRCEQYPYGRLAIATDQDQMAIMMNIVQDATVNPSGYPLRIDLTNSGGQYQWGYASSSRSPPSMSPDPSINYQIDMSYSDESFFLHADGKLLGGAESMLGSFLCSTNPFEVERW